MAFIGIMGGTFNPIHLGHVAIAKEAFKQFHLDEVWFMPNHLPAYKSDKNLASGEDRLAMTQLAISDIPGFKLSDFELKRSGRTYTSETISLLHDEYPEHTFYFIMGADSLYYFDKWKEPEVILQYATVLAAPRDSKNMNQLKERVEELDALYGKGHFYLIDCPQIPCSSSKIRENLHTILHHDGVITPEILSEKLFLPVSVCNYILQHDLYL